MKRTKVFLLTAAISASIFAQDYYHSAPTPPPPPPPTMSSAPAAVAQNGGTGTRIRIGNRHINLRFSGDAHLNAGFEFNNNFHHDYERVRNNDGSWAQDNDGNAVYDTVRVDSHSDEFSMLYNLNFRVGFDFGERFSANVRFSNPRGYAQNNLGEWRDLWPGSEYTYGIDDFFRGWRLPWVPSAYITLKPNPDIAFSAGLLEIKGNSVLDLVAGSEGMIGAFDAGVSSWWNYGGIWTNYYNWDIATNRSQVGFTMDFALSPNLSINFATLAPTEEDFRFILGADIGLGDVVTLSPVVSARSFRNMSYEFTNIAGDDVSKTPVLVAYGADLGFELSDAFNLDLGFALGHIRLNTDEREGVYNDALVTHNEKITGLAVLLKFAPTISLGIGDLGLSYSLGIGNINDRAEASGGATLDHKSTNGSLYHDLSLGFMFRLNDNVAFGPQFDAGLRRERSKTVTASSIPFYPGYPVTDEADNKLTGLNHFRIGLGFTASF